MKHYDFNDWILYCNDTLDSAIKEEMENHLYSCDKCLELYLSVIEGNIEKNIEVMPSKDFTANVMNEINATKSQDKSNKKYFPEIFLYYVAAASITLLLMNKGFFTYLFNNVPSATAQINNSQLKLDDLFKSGWSQRLTDHTVNFLDSLIDNR